MRLFVGFLLGVAALYAAPEIKSGADRLLGRTWMTTSYAVANPLGNSWSIPRTCGYGECPVSNSLSRTWLTSGLFDKAPSPFATIVTQSGQCDTHGHCTTNPLHLSAPRLAN